MQLFPDRFEAPVASVHFNSLGELCLSISTHTHTAASAPMVVTPVSALCPVLHCGHCVIPAVCR